MYVSHLSSLDLISSAKRSLLLSSSLLDGRHNDHDGDGGDDDHDGGDGDDDGDDDGDGGEFFALPLINPAKDNMMVIGDKLWLCPRLNLYDWTKMMMIIIVKKLMKTIIVTKKMVYLALSSAFMMLKDWTESTCKVVTVK